MMAKILELAQPTISKIIKRGIAKDAIAIACPLIPFSSCKAYLREDSRWIHVKVIFSRSFFAVREPRLYAQRF